MIQARDPAVVVDAIAAVHPAAMGLVVAAWLVLLPIRVRLGARLAAQALLLLASGLAQWLGRGGAVWSWVFVVVLGSWIPVLVWLKQVYDDQELRRCGGLPELWQGSSSKGYWSTTSGWWLYRRRMIHSAISWNRLWHRARVGKRLPAWLQTRALDATSEPQAASDGRLQRLVAELHRQGVTGAVRYAIREDGDYSDLLLSLDQRDYERLDNLRSRRALRRAAALPVTLLCPEDEWRGSQPLQPLA